MSKNLLTSSSIQVLDHLEWPSLVKKLQSHCYLPPTQNAIEKCLTYRGAHQIQALLTLTESLVEEFLNDGKINFESYLNSLSGHDSQSFDLHIRIQKQHVLDFDELNFACLLVETHLHAKNAIHLLPDFCRSAFDPTQLEKLSRDFVKPLRKLVSSTGEILFENHPVLKELFRKLDITHKNIRQKLSDLKQSSLYKNALQFSEHDVINDTFVLAVKTDAYQNKHGDIRGRSSSGSTLFVEPYSLNALNRQQINILSQIEEVKNKLCLEFSQILYPMHKSFASIEQNLIQLDMAQSKAKFCVYLNLKKPRVASTPQIKVQGFFHPLIDRPQKNDIELPEKPDCLGIYGPNAGGKTVTLKSICLCHLFLHMGLFVPADDAEIYPFKGIFYFSHDHQSLLDGLSSFSSEVKNYLDLLRELTDNNIIFVDEIFNSTGSDEASALAMGLFEYIQARGDSKIMISTHHQLLKTVAHNSPFLLSGHMQYDEDNHNPLFRLQTGTPGSSMAMQIFNRLGNSHFASANIIQTANKILESKQVTFETALQEVAKKNAELNFLLEENRHIHQRLKHEEKTQRGLLDLKMQDEFKHFSQFLEQLREKGEQIIQSVQRGELKKNKKLWDKVSDIKSQANQLIPEKQVVEDGPQYLDEAPISVQKGEKYFSLLLKKIVYIDQPNDKRKEAQIGKGSFKLLQPYSQLRKLKGKAEASKVNVQIDISRDESIEHDLRGYLLDDFQNRVYQLVDSLRAGKLPYLHIIHGHGSGVLKKWLRDYLQKEEDLLFSMPEQSRDGSTEIKLSR